MNRGATFFATAVEQCIGTDEVRVLSAERPSPLNAVFDGQSRCGRNNQRKERELRFETLAVHAGTSPDRVTGAVSPAIQLSTTFERAPDGSFTSGYEYSRDSNPNRHALEAVMTSLEGGAAAVAFASGMAATMDSTVNVAATKAAAPKAISLAGYTALEDESLPSLTRRRYVSANGTAIVLLIIKPPTEQKRSLAATGDGVVIRCLQYEWHQQCALADARSRL